MKFKKLLALGAALVFSVAFIAGCGSNNSDNGAKKELSYSKSQGPYSELFEKGVKPILEKQGYTFKGVDMSDLVQADQVLSDGEVDFNVEQHTAYMKNFNEKQNGHLVALTPSRWTPPPFSRPSPDGPNRHNRVAPVFPKARPIRQSPY